MSEIRDELRSDPHWRRALAPAGRWSVGLHLAVFVEPFLSHVLSGRKSIESRFSMVRCAPFGRVALGDIILLKAAGGPVRGICEVANAWYYDLRSVPLSSLRTRFAEAICATDDAFWRSRGKSEYATLLKLRSVREVNPMPCPKRDRRGWVVLRGERQLAIPEAI